MEGGAPAYLSRIGAGFGTRRTILYQSDPDRASCRRLARVGRCMGEEATAWIAIDVVFHSIGAPDHLST